jgi:hypothetical protein
VKSTTGAYSAFPDYYYAPGNLFATYLRGGSSGSAVGRGEGMHIAPPRRSLPGSRSPALQSVLARFVKGRIGREDTIFLYEQLFPDQKLIRDASRADPWSALDRRALKNLSSADQRRIIERLEAAMTARRALPSGKPKRKRSAGDGKTTGAEATRVTKTNRKANSPTITSQEKRRSQGEQTVTDLACSLCSAPLTDQDRAKCSDAPTLFYGRGYCADHAEKIKALTR